MYSFLRKKNFLTFIDKMHLYKNAMMKFIVLYDKNIFRMRKRLFIHIYVLIALFVLKSSLGSFKNALVDHVALLFPF